MSKVGEFKVIVEGVANSVKEVAEGQKTRDGRHCAAFGDIAPLGTGSFQRAEAHAAFLTREHSRGRVPQSVCGPVYAPRVKPDEPRVIVHHATPCDHDRVNVPEVLTEAQRASLVFCKRHVGSFGIPVSDANAAWLAAQEPKS